MISKMLGAFAVKWGVRLLYRQHRQEMRMAVDLLRAGFKPAAIPDLIKRFRRYDT